MEAEEILEKNGIIAQYMGAEIRGEYFRFRLGNPSDYIKIKQYYFKPFDCLHYHECWGQLMPVWHKLREELKDEDIVTQTYFQSIAFALAKYGILTTFKKIVEAIEWLNSQKTNQNKKLN